MTEESKSQKDSLPWYAALLLIRPGRIRENLEKVRAAKLVEKTPNRWQIFLGVMRMLYRTIYYPESVGLSTEFAVRPGWRARLFQYRFIRGPFLFWEGSVAPLDLSGLASQRETLIRHLLGTHHDGDGAIYDLRLLSIQPGALDELKDRLLAVIEKDCGRSHWLKDLCVYEEYHNQLLEIVERVLAGNWETTPGEGIIDTSFESYLDWCATRPDNPKESWRAWREGRLGLEDAAPELSILPKETAVQS
ncbi:MAG: hypothetical protein P1V97_06820 [Planctomycetota bacterium]|nr:hypothetical protein [Planctomycetota bacterium]